MKLTPPPNLLQIYRRIYWERLLSCRGPFNLKVWQAMRKQSHRFPSPSAFSLPACPHQFYLLNLSRCLLDTPYPLSPRPPCGMLYRERPMEEGHPGTQLEHTQRHTHTYTNPLTDTCKMCLSLSHTRMHTYTHTQTNTAVESHQNPLADAQIKDHWCRRASVHREIENEEEKKAPIFHACYLKGWT